MADVCNAVGDVLWGWFYLIDGYDGWSAPVVKLMCGCDEVFPCFLCVISAVL